MSDHDDGTRVGLWLYLLTESIIRRYARRVVCEDIGRTPTGGQR